MSSTDACLSCGAALASGADQCALCGTPAGEYAPDTLAPISPDALPPEASGVSQTTCDRCGHTNPEGSRYCNRCGTRLASVVLPPQEALPVSGERPPSDVGKRAVTFVGVAVAAVIALYALTAVMGDDPKELEPDPNALATPAGAATPATNPLPEGPTPSLPTADMQQQAAAFEAQETAEGYYEAARFYLTASFQSQTESIDDSRKWANRAVQLLEQSLEIEENPNVRVALAEATVFEGVNPMRPIQEAQAVLAANPTHPGANLFIGQRRLMIGREDQAREAFEIVVANTEPGDDARRSAESALEMMDSGAIPGVE